MNKEIKKYVEEYMDDYYGVETDASYVTYSADDDTDDIINDIADRLNLSKEIVEKEIEENYSVVEAEISNPETAERSRSTVTFLIFKNQEEQFKKEIAEMQEREELVDLIKEKYYVDIEIMRDVDMDDFEILDEYTKSEIKELEKEGDKERMYEFFGDLIETLETSFF